MKHRMLWGLIFTSLYCGHAQASAAEPRSLLTTELVYDLSPTDTTISCHVILPYKQDMKEVFLNEEMFNAAQHYGLHYSSKLKHLHKRFTTAVVILANKSTDQAIYVKDPYVHAPCLPGEQEHPISLYRHEFLAHYPSLQNAKDPIESHARMTIAAGICLGGLSLVGMLKAGENYAFPVICLLGGAVVGALGVQHRKKMLAPICALEQEYQRLVNSLQPKVVPGIVSIDGDETTLRELLSKPLNRRIHEHVYEIHPGETLIQTVLIPSTCVQGLDKAVLTYFLNNPHFIHAVHASLKLASAPVLED